MAHFSAANLRDLADMLDALAEATARTGVTVTSYGDDHLTANDHVIRIDWQPGDGENRGQYVADWPDKH